MYKYETENEAILFAEKERDFLKQREWNKSWHSYTLNKEPREATLQDIEIYRQGRLEFGHGK